jgi:pyrimidine-nucleoside phosphorylase
MIALSLNIDTGLANSMVLDAISSGKALLKLREWISVQGGDASFIDKPEMLLNSTYKSEYIAKSDGYISKMTADKIGYASMQLGAGRKKLGDTIDYTAGIIFNKSYGDFVKKGEAIATMYSSSSSFDACILTLDSAIFITKDEPNKEALIFDTIE